MGNSLRFIITYITWGETLKIKTPHYIFSNTMRGKKRRCYFLSAVNTFFLPIRSRKITKIQGINLRNN